MFCLEESKKAMTKKHIAIDALIIGLGKTGLSCVRHLKNKGVDNLMVTDTRSHPPALDYLTKQFPDVQFVAGELDAELCLLAEQIIVSPGVSLREPALQTAIKKGKDIVGDIEIFCREAKSPIIAITGSNGKSTVTTLLSLMAKADNKTIETGANLGTPALDLLDKSMPEFYVLELSSFQLDTTFSMNTLASAVLNISSDHMDRYDDIEQYAAAKQKIYMGNGTAVINFDDERVAAMQNSSKKTVSYSIDEDKQADFHLHRAGEHLWLCHGDEKIITTAELGIKGKHNISNALASMALANEMAVSYDAMRKALKSFNGLKHRCQLVKNIDGVDWINDSKATNVGASIAAIEGLNRPGKIILIAGGDSKGADITTLLPVLTKHVKHLLLIGHDADRFVELVDNQISFEKMASLQEAVEHAATIGAAGDAVLLAPACASLDMFEDYQQRGDSFANAVMKLSEH